ncbi:polysaccharide biosynthesis/export family protein [Terricaulis sp.]|uniref:polysaccharide biosynthesis/export family protein n=1 Tax=Terricaulis sp. TaxID=2768686 RepID=UPI003784B354
MITRRSVGLFILMVLAAPALARAQRDPSNAGSEYRFAAGDQLRITVFGNPDLTGTFAISATGNLSYPLIGDVPALGLTATELADRLTERLRDGYVRNPRIAIEVAAYRPFFILGEVQRPGSYPYTANLTVHNAIATAGGWTPRANRRRVFIKHSGEDDERAYPLQSDTPVAPGDTVRIGERWF